MCVGRSKQVDAADFLGLSDNEAVGLDADRNREVYESFVAFVDCRRNGADEDSILVESVDYFGGNVRG